MVLDSIAGYDQLDPAAVDVPVPDYTRAFEMQTSSLRLGIPRSPFFQDLDPEVAAAVETAIGILRKHTRSIADVQLPNPSDILTTIVVEASAYHAKWIVESPDRYQPLTRQRLLSGADMKAGEYARALRQMNLQRREISSVFSDVDVLVTPTMTRTAESLAESKNFDRLGFRNTSPFDSFGLPSITVPSGFSAAGLPIGLQMTGAPFAESTVLALAHVFEQETPWHAKRPQLTNA